MFHDVNAAVGVSGRKAEEGCFMMLTLLLVFHDVNVAVGV